MGRTTFAVVLQALLSGHLAAQPCCILAVRRFGIRPVSESELAHSEEEIRLILGQSRRYAKGPALGKDIALNAFALRQRRVREVMTPRHEIVVLNTEDTDRRVPGAGPQTRYSRFRFAKKATWIRRWASCMSRICWTCSAGPSRTRSGGASAQDRFRPGKRAAGKVLSLFLRCKLHLALVVDEFGDTLGLLTLENVLEELVGPIEDEFRHEESASGEREKRLGRSTGRCACGSLAS